MGGVTRSAGQSIGERSQGRSLRGQAGRMDISKEPLMCPYKKASMAAGREPNILARRKALPLV